MLDKNICFITTGDVKDIATAKRALGLANPLAALGWKVSILMEDTNENRHRVSLECNDNIKVYYFPKSSVYQERRDKNILISKINPSFLYICAFVTRNIVGFNHPSKKLVEHSELQSSIPNIGIIKRIIHYIFEYVSIFYSDGIINASKYLQDLYIKRAKRIFRKKITMLYSPYAYNKSLINLKKIDFSNKKWQSYQGKKCFIFLGSIVKNYGAFTILKAAKDLLDQNIRNFKILMIGKGTAYQDALNYVKKENIKDNIELPGYIEEEEISYYFSLASGFILPMNNTIQDWARCPSKLYMYLPYGKPIVTCKVGEPYEVLKDKGYYFEIGSHKSLASELKRIILNDEKSNIDSNNHTWDFRAFEFNRWIENNFDL